MTATRVTLRNETSRTLTLAASQADDEWTDAWSPPLTIAAHSEAGFRSEGDSPMDGTGGFVEYDVSGSDQPMRIQWRNPLIGLAHYEQSVPTGLGIYFEGGKGSDARAVYSLIPSTRVAVPGYLPSRHGFRFTNHWPDGVPLKRIELPDPFANLPIGNAGWGMCGGMSSASIDYFLGDRWAPQWPTPPAGPGDVLFDYLANRQLESFGGGAIWDFIKYSNPVYPDTDDLFLGDGRNWTMAHHSWPAIRREIDSGRPVLLGVVVGTWTVPAHLGHQVLAYAYALSGNHLTLWVYDPNNPYQAAVPHGHPVAADDVRIEIDMSRTDTTLLPIRHDLNLGQPGDQPRLTCFFPTPYSPANAPFGIAPVPIIALDYLAEDDGAEKISAVSQTIPDGCLRGTYAHEVVAVGQRLKVTADVAGVANPSVSWQIDGQPAAGAMALPKTATVPQDLLGVNATMVTPILFNATASGASLVIDVPAEAGNFSIDVSATANGVAASTAHLDIGVRTSRFKSSAAWVLRLRDCAGALYVLPPEIGKLPSDPPWHDIFGPDFVAPRPPVFTAAVSEPEREAVYRRRGQLDLVLGMLSSPEISAHRTEVANDIVAVFTAED
jgi:hypothetical protein